MAAERTSCAWVAGAARAAADNIKGTRALEDAHRVAQNRRLRRPLACLTRIHAIIADARGFWWIDRKGTHIPRAGTRHSPDWRIGQRTDVGNNGREGAL